MGGGGLVSFLMISAAALTQAGSRKLQNLGWNDRGVHSGIILDTMGEPGMKFFPLIATLFLFILFANLLD